MAVILATTIKNFLGLAADVKPDAAAGSRFFETDTGNLYISDGAGTWNLMNPNAMLVDSAGAELFSAANPASIKLTGRNLQQFQLINAVAITDTNWHDKSNTSGIFQADLRNYAGPKLIYIKSTLDQAATINVNGARLDSAVERFLVLGNKIVNAAGILVISGADSLVLNSPLPYLDVSLKCNTAPTTGSISAWLVYVQS